MSINIPFTFKTPRPVWVQGLSGFSRFSEYLLRNYIVWDYLSHFDWDYTTASCIGDPSEESIRRTWLIFLEERARFFLCRFIRESLLDEPWAALCLLAPATLIPYQRTFLIEPLPLLLNNADPCIHEVVEQFSVLPEQLATAPANAPPSPPSPSESTPASSRSTSYYQQVYKWRHRCLKCGCRGHNRRTCDEEWSQRRANWTAAKVEAALSKGRAMLAKKAVHVRAINARRSMISYHRRHSTLHRITHLFEQDDDAAPTHE